MKKPLIWKILLPGIPWENQSPTDVLIGGMYLFVEIVFALFLIGAGSLSILWTLLG